MEKNTHFHKGIKILAIIGSAFLILIIGIFIFLKLTFLKTFPTFRGEVEIGKWYDVPVKSAKSSDGSEWHGIFRKGSENKVIVYFFGGGVSIAGETSEAGKNFFATTVFGQDFVAQGGIGSTVDENPFKDWTFIVVPYASGDFHTGTGEYHYTQDGKDKTVYHNGYNNYSAFIDEIKAYVGEPDTLLVTGFSAGGFATSLLADDVIGRFPTAKNVTVCVDGDNVKILFDCSYRDDTLLQYQSYINTGVMDKTKELGDQFQNNLREMVIGLQTNIPNVGIYIWNLNEDPTTHNTQHTIISSNFLDKLENGKSVCDWLYDAVNGNVQSIGLGLINS